MHARKNRFSPLGTVLIRATSLAAGLAAALAADPAIADGDAVGVPVIEGPVDPVIVTQFCFRYYVDPVNGSDTNNGTLGAPFGTIAHAMAMASLTKPAVLILLPGVYSPFSPVNPQPFPVPMEDNVSIQGTSVMNTVLDGGGFAPSLLLFQNPATGGKQFANTVVDGVTLQNAQIGVSMDDEFRSVRVTIANCMIVKNQIGISMRAFYLGPNQSPDDTDGNGYIEFEPRIVHCTIADNEVGILDSTPGAGWGEARSAIINCIVWPNSCSDLEGVDDKDLNTVAFATSDACGISVAASVPISALPMASLTPDSVFVDAAACDYRQLPQSPTVDIGTNSLSVPNGTTAKALFPCGVSIRDCDGEEYGNLRFERNAYDIGADELGTYLVAGYMPNTTRFGTDGLGNVFNQATVWVTPSVDLGSPLSGMFVTGIGPTTGYLQWLPQAFPGARPSGTIRPTQYQNFGLLWINSSTWIPPVNLPLPGSGVAFSTVLTLPVSDVRQNMQVLPRNPATAQFAPLSNLQSFLIGP
jgi:hypothetical protein